jgi:hypothetical protein
MAIMPTEEEARKQAERIEKKHQENLKLRPYIDHSFADLIELMISNPKDSCDYKILKNEINYRLEEVTRLKINPIFDPI